VLNFSPTDAAFGKNPANLPPLSVPEISTEPRFLGEVIQSIKDKLNSLTEEQQKRQAAIADWLASFDEAKTAKDFNELVSTVQTADPSIIATVKGALWKIATEAGFKFDKTVGAFVEAA